MRFKTIDLTPRIGTEVQTDRETLLNGSKADEIRQILEHRGVITVRGINLSDDELLNFSKTLGEVIPQGDKGVYKVTLDKSENSRAYNLRGAFYWHIDGTTDDIPTRASIMGARRLSQTGGQTEFANTYAAWDDLPDSRKLSIEKLQVVHSIENILRLVYPTPDESQLRDWKEYTPKTHPLVWNHQSGRKSLVLGATSGTIKGMDQCAARTLLTELEEWASQPQFVYRHEWTPGDLIIWDNTGTMHRVLPYAIDSGRMMHRVTLVGEERLA
jgi:alpha-ketoglutarate-dependent taurine dioxygenase